MRLAIIVSHPVQYYSPWFRHIATAMGRKAAADALRVFYLWDFGVTEKVDRGFGEALRWDRELLSGYDYEFVPNTSKDPGTHWFGGLVNPELRQRVEAFLPDAVLQFGYNHSSLVAFDLSWRNKRAPLLFRGDSHLLAEEDAHGWHYSSLADRIKALLRRVVLFFLFRRFSRFLAVGTANAAYFRAHGVAESKIVICPHAVDNAFFLGLEVDPVDVPSDKPAYYGESRGMREQLGISGEELVFLFAGKLEAKKQPLLLLEAFCCAKLPPALLFFAGSGALAAPLRRRLLDEGWEAQGPDCFRRGAKRVLFLPFQNQSRMPDVYRTGDVLVLPSRGRYETWGLAVNEAAACGLPAIVSSHVGCGPDLIENGVTGWTFKSGDCRALTRVLEQAGAERGQLIAAGNRLRRKISKEYSFEVATAALLEVLGSIRSASDERRIRGTTPCG